MLLYCRRAMGLFLLFCLLLPFYLNLTQSFSIEDAMLLPYFAGSRTPAKEPTAFLKAPTEEDEIYCNTTGSLHQMALEMANFSSPPGSPSYNKALRILNGVTHYKTYMPYTQDNYRGILQHLKSMFVGFGLKNVFRAPPDLDYRHFLRVETVLRNCKENCTDQPRIILQSEQIWYYEERYLRILQTCHESRNCLILDFSDYNYRFAQKHNFADSVLMLPLMIQSRLGYVDSLNPFHNRSLDVVFFAEVEGRRKRFRDMLVANKTDWSILFEFRDDGTTKGHYNDAKICLIMHRYQALSAGEYHRLSEFAPMGCIPVMESSGDQLFLEPYRRCARVIFADHDDLIETMESVRQELHSGDAVATNFRHVEWWHADIRWEEVLSAIFGPHSPKK